MVDVPSYEDLPLLGEMKTVVIDVYHFDPSSLSVLTNGEMLVFSGSHSEQVDELGYASRSFQRIYRLGKRVKSKRISVVINPARFMLIRCLDSDEFEKAKINYKKSVESYISPDNVGILHAKSTIALNNALFERLGKAVSGYITLQQQMFSTESQGDHNTAFDPDLPGPSAIPQHRSSESRPDLEDPQPGPSGIQRHPCSESFSEREFEKTSKSLPVARFEQHISERSSKGGLEKGKGKYKAVCKISERYTYILPTSSISTAAAPDMPSTTETSDLSTEIDQGTIAQGELSAQNIKKRASDQSLLHADPKRLKDEKKDENKAGKKDQEED